MLHEEWYARDPQGNELAVYERYEDNGFIVTRLKERAIYGSDRLGLDLIGMEIGRRPVELGPGGASNQRAHALLVGEILYDSPATPSDERHGKERHDGEYVLTSTLLRGAQCGV